MGWHQHATGYTHLQSFENLHGAGNASQHALQVANLVNYPSYAVDIQYGDRTSLAVFTKLPPLPP